MPGIAPFVAVTIGKETTPGTAVATTRELYPDGTGLLQIDRMRTYHEGAHRGTRSNITHATQMGLLVTIPFSTSTDVGVSYDDLIIPFSFLDGGNSGVGAGADKTWTMTPNQATAGTFDTFTVEVGDDIQNYEVEYCVATAFRLSAGQNDLTQLAMDLVGRQATKSTATTVAGNNGLKIPSNLWTYKFATSQAGLAGASVVTNLVTGFDLEVISGLVPRFYHDGNKYFGQIVAADEIGGTLHLTVESTATAVSQFYDKAAADTVDFIRLKATGDALGASNYSAQIDLAVLYDEPEPLAGEDAGVMLYDVTARLVYDSTWTNSVIATIVNSLGTMP